MVPTVRTDLPDTEVLELLFRSSPSCIKLLDLDGTLLLINDRGASLLECDRPGPVIGRNWLAYLTGDDREAARQAIETARSGGIGRFQGCLATKGMARWWDTTIIPVPGHGGRPRALLAVSTEVSDRHELTRRLETTLRRTHALILATSEIVWHADAGQQKGGATGAFIGLVEEPVYREEWLARIHPEDRERVDAFSRSGMAGRTRYVHEYRLLHRRGGYRWVEDSVVPLTGEGDEILEWVGVISDIHERVAAGEALRESEERLRLALKASRVGIWDVDLRTGRRRWSNELKEIIGLPASAPETEELLFSLIHPEDRPIVDEAHRTAFRSTSDLTFRIRRADTGEERWVLSKGSPVLDRAGLPIRRIGTMQDITERKLNEHRLWAAANHDPLTTLPNRTLFTVKLEAALAVAQEAGTRVALLIVDLDRFKDVNDTLGHAAGDVVLQTAARRFAGLCTPSMTVARLGGDEFAILLAPAGSPEEVARAAASMIRMVSGAVPYGEGEIALSVSMGLAVYPDHDADGGELLKNADLALYVAKRGGRARCALFDPAMKTALQKRFCVLQKAREALLKNTIAPYYQPKVDLGDGSLCGFEALLRWRDGSGLQSPGALAEAFEDPEIAAQIGQRMLDLVIADLRRWRAEGLPTGSIGLNVSAVEFARADVAGAWLDKLAQAGLPPTSLEIEVTESVFLSCGSDAVGRALDILHRHGVAIALDDFGTGYASLTHLRHYPVHWLKIDRSFTADLGRDSGAETIVSAVINLAHGIGLRVVAEGVETEAQARMLQRKGCDLAQGYLIAKPMPASRVPHFCRSWAGFGWDRPAPVAARRRRGA
jgi:diguanylate cyclase (GGDEF)-like protein/PAS domain S-box-containing protein